MTLLTGMYIKTWFIYPLFMLFIFTASKKGREISKMICSTYFKKNQIQVGLSKYFEVEESLLLDWTLSLSCLFDREVDEMFKNAEAFIHYPRCQLKMGTETTPRRSWRKYLERCLRLVDFEVSCDFSLVK